jgi:hypothetical protein
MRGSYCCVAAATDLNDAEANALGAGKYGTLEPAAVEANGLTESLAVDETTGVTAARGFVADVEAGRASRGENEAALGLRLWSEFHFRSAYLFCNVANHALVLYITKRVEVVVGGGVGGGGMVRHANTGRLSILYLEELAHCLVVAVVGYGVLDIIVPLHPRCCGILQQPKRCL